MKRQINNLLFLFSFMIALFIGRTDYVQFGRSLLAEVDFKLEAFSKTNTKDIKVIEQNNYQTALPNEAYIQAHQSFMEGKYINKTLIVQRVAGGIMSSPGAIITATTNHGRDGP